ncbi:hypothetical protein [Celeribacter sp.]|uniref:hypothetical protein n=1 Tax=Celeribacter sp. TaxID=1890673 RepID=UPI003A93C7E7
MMLIEAICTIKDAIDRSSAEADDGPWLSAIGKAGLVAQGNTRQGAIDEAYTAHFGDIELRFRHYWRDTSRTFSPGPDRTTMTLTVLSQNKAIDSYSKSYDT